MPKEPIGVSLFWNLSSQIIDIQEEKRLLRHKEESLKKNIPALLEGALRTFSEDEAREKCEELYWLCVDFKGRAEIKAAFKKAFGKPLKVEAPWTTSCDGCGGELEVTTSSWRDFRRKKSRKNYCEGECSDNAADGMYG